MSQETLKMSAKERNRLHWMRKVVAGELLLKEAAYHMGVSIRQAIRIKKAYLAYGDAGLVHSARGVPSNRGKPQEFKERALAFYKERYWDFGPVLAAEKMCEHEGVEINRETLRRWLVSERICRPRKAKVRRERRKRRSHFGDLVQIDGSQHAWFEGRAPRCTLMVAVDDATSTIALHMAREETTRDALWLLRKWVKQYGVPAALYADQRTAYFTQEYIHNPKRRNDPAVFTDFMKATDRLSIKMIPAYSPQAKGRVERYNGTLQDRLVKELRLRGISTIEAANRMLDDFAREMNQKFSRPPAKRMDAHRPKPKGKWSWDYYFCTEEDRVVQNDHVVVHVGEKWQILRQPDGPMPKDKVSFRKPLQGSPYWVWKEKRLKVRRAYA